MFHGRESAFCKLPESEIILNAIKVVLDSSSSMLLEGSLAFIPPRNSSLICHTQAPFLLVDQV